MDFDRSPLCSAKLSAYLETRGWLGPLAHQACHSIMLPHNQTCPTGARHAVVSCNFRNESMLNIIRYLSGMRRSQKVALQLVADAILVVLCFLAAMALRLDGLEFIGETRIWTPLVIATAAALATFHFVGLYRSLMRFVTGKILIPVGKGVAAFSIVLFASNAILDAGVPRSIPLISAVLILPAIAGLRFAIRQLFRKPIQTSKKPVIIFGAGEAGRELLNSLFHGRKYAPVAFVDDDPALHGLTVSGFPGLPFRSNHAACRGDRDRSGSSRDAQSQPCASPRDLCSARRPQPGGQNNPWDV